MKKISYLVLLLCSIAMIVLVVIIVQEQASKKQKLKSVLIPKRSMEYYKEPLIKAVKANNIPLIKQLIELGADVNEDFGADFPHYGFTPLAIAIENNLLEMAQLLIDAGADVNEARDTDGISDISGDHPDHDSRNNTLLASAVIFNLPEMVQLLIDNGADVESAFGDWTPLMIARYNKRTEIEKMLIDAGAKK